MEVMVVVAILAVLGGVGIWGVGAMTGKPAQQCAQKIMYSLERHRMTAMGKVSAKYELYEKDRKVYLKEYVGNDPEHPENLSVTQDKEIGAVGVEVKYKLGSGDELKDLPLTLEFDRSSGSFKTQAGGGYCTRIIVSRGGRDYEVALVPLTGKVYID